jgi:glycosyltransferase involved in cell wall biosynthesis
MTLVSIIVPTRNSEKTIEKCLQSLLRNEGPFEIVVVDDSEDQTPEIVSKYPVRLIKAKGKNISEARNIGITNTTGEIIAFTDDDCEVPAFWLSKARPLFRDEKVAAVGGPNLTPPGAEPREKYAGIALSSWFASGVSSARYSAKDDAAAREVDESKLITCNLFFRRDALKQVGLFNPSQIPCEENELMHRLRKEGYRLLYAPTLYVHHRRRAIFVPLAKQIHWYGIGRGLLTRRSPESLKIIHVMPSIFVVGLIGGLLTAPIDVTIRTIYFLTLLVYLTTLMMFSIRAVRQEKESPAGILFLMVAMFLIHVAYGVGFMKGLLFGSSS